MYDDLTGILTSRVATNIDGYVLGREKIDYSVIFELGRVLHSLSQEMCYGLERTQALEDPILKHVGKTLEEIGTDYNMHNELFDISQDFAAFGSLEKEKQEALRDFAAKVSINLSNYSRQVRERGTRFMFAA